MSTIAHVQTVEEPYLRELSKIDSGSSWQTAEVLSRWKRETKQSDSDIARATGYNQSHVSRMIRIYEDFSGDRYREHLLFGHYKEALSWDDADKWLAKAAQGRWTVPQMRNARNEEAVREEPMPSGHNSEPDEDTDDVEVIEDVEVIDDFVPTDEQLDDEEEPPSQPQHVVPTPRAEAPKPTATVMPRLKVPFELGERLSSPAGLINAVLRELRTVSREFAEDVPQFTNRMPHIEVHLKNALSELLFVTPTKECPECGGHGTTATGQCKRCKGAGWIGKE